jgi:hypothetical protein
MVFQGGWTGANCPRQPVNVPQQLIINHHMFQVPRALYPLDVAIMDFGLFRTMTNRLRQIHPLNGNDFFQHSDGIVQSIFPDELRRVFVVWITPICQMSSGIECSIRNDRI